MPLCTFLHPSSRGRLSDVLETVFRAPQLAELWLSAPAEYGRPAMSGRMLLMPLRSDLGDVTRALGCLIAEGEIGNAPRRFNMTDDRVMPVFDGAETVSPSPSARGFAETRPTWQDERRPDVRARNADGNQTSGGSDPAPNRDIPSPEERRALFRVVSRND